MEGKRRRLRGQFDEVVGCVLLRRLDSLAFFAEAADLKA